MRRKGFGRRSETVALANCGVGSDLFFGVSDYGAS